jgi:hypothetical protein
MRVSQIAIGGYGMCVTIQLTGNGMFIIIINITASEMQNKFGCFQLITTVVEPFRFLSNLFSTLHSSRLRLSKGLRVVCDLGM